MFVQEWKQDRPATQAGIMKSLAMRITKIRGSLIEKALKKRNISIHTLAVEKDSISLSRAEQLKHATGGAQFVSAEETLNQFRLIKDDNEIRLLKEAAKLADYGVEVGTAALREGISEVEVLAQIEYEI